MKPISVMVNGIPGNVAINIASHAVADARFSLIPFSLTGPEIEDTSVNVAGAPITLILPDERDQKIVDVMERHAPFISIDYTHPAAVNSNAAFYCEHKLPFVMGTTGGDRERLLQQVSDSTIPAIVAPNMAKQIVGFQAMMEYAADTFPGLFKGYSLEIRESHQQGKADTSGTAKAMVRYFNRLGIPFTDREILQERDPAKQVKEWGIPPEHLSGHGWHTYTLHSPDRTASFVFKHNINGRDIYADGTLDAVCYLQERIQAGAGGQVFSMIDVLKQR